MRRRRPEKREILPDPIYGELMVQKFINNLMKGGKRSVSEKIFYSSLEIVKSKTKSNSLEMFKKAMDNVKPLIEVKSRRIGGATYQVPIQVPPQRGFALATRWIIAYATARKGRSMSEKLAAEFVDAANNDGGAVKKKEDTHRMAEANKAFAHYR